MPLQIRRGTAAERAGLTTPLAIGELLYVTDQGKLYIGDGTSIGAADIAGTPAQGGKGLIITGFTTEEAQDATNTLFSNGTHTNITFSYNDNANSLSATVDLSSYAGNIAVNGTIDADFRGSVFADNSTLLVDAVSGFIPASVVSGTFTGNVIGNLTGNTSGEHSGNVVTNLISSSDSSTIAVDTPIEFQTDVEIDGNVVINDNTVINADLTSNKLLVETRDPNLNVLSMGQQHNQTDPNLSAGISLRRSRGLGVSPEAVLAGDQIFKITFNGFDGSDFISAVSIRGMVDPAGTVSTNAVPGKLEFFVNDNDGVSKLRMELDRVGTFINYGQHWVRNNVENSLVQNLTSHYNSAGQGSRLSLRRSRGTYDSPTAVTSGDALFRIVFGGYDGTNYVESAFIRSTVAGTVSTGVVPSNITISTTNTSGATSVAMEISESQNVKVNKSLTLPTYADSTARDAAITSPQGGMLVYITGTNKFQGYVSGTGWTDLN